jgi:hypothetical protein
MASIERAAHDAVATVSMFAYQYLSPSRMILTVVDAHCGQYLDVRRIYYKTTKDKTRKSALQRLPADLFYTG